MTWDQEAKITKGLIGAALVLYGISYLLGAFVKLEPFIIQADDVPEKKKRRDR